jgi:hypothetical protein
MLECTVAKEFWWMAREATGMELPALSPATMGIRPAVADMFRTRPGLYLPPSVLEKKI